MSAAPPVHDPPGIRASRVAQTSYTTPIGQKDTLAAGHCSYSLIGAYMRLDTESAIASEYQSCNWSVASEGYANAKDFAVSVVVRFKEGKGEIHLTPKFPNNPTELTTL